MVKNLTEILKNLPMAPLGRVAPPDPHYDHPHNNKPTSYTLA